MLALIYILLAPPTPAAEVQRLTAWFEQADAIVAQHAIPADPAQVARRQRVIDDLHAYVSGGLFPHHASTAWSPVFVDDDGTRCAMAHLIELSGDDALMWRIASTQNRAYIVDLADDPELIGWLDWHGLSAEAAAAIQPTYGAPRRAPDCICREARVGGRPPDTVLSVAPAGDGLRIVENHRPEKRVPAALEAAIVDRSATGLDRLRGPAPWLIAIRNGAVSAQLPSREPCPPEAPYPGPPAPLTHGQMAGAVLAGGGCGEALAAIDERWLYTPDLDEPFWQCAQRPGAPVGWAGLWFLAGIMGSMRARRSAGHDRS